MEFRLTPTILRLRLERQYKYACANGNFHLDELPISLFTAIATYVNFRLFGRDRGFWFSSGEKNRRRQLVNYHKKLEV